MLRSDKNIRINLPSKSVSTKICKYGGCCNATGRLLTTFDRRCQFHRQVAGDAVGLDGQLFILAIIEHSKLLEVDRAVEAGSIHHDQSSVCFGEGVWVQRSHSHTAAQTCAYGTERVYGQVPLAQNPQVRSTAGDIATLARRCG